MSILEEISRIYSDKDPKPNKYTIAIGKLIKQAREEAHMTQAELARLSYRRRATISDIETGKADVDIVLLTLFAHILQKPIIYFFSTWRVRLQSKDELSALEQEILYWFNRLPDDNIRNLAIEQIKVLDKLYLINENDDE
jgi:transcriptional regulator with XRE-family HTH domain